MEANSPVPLGSNPFTLYSHKLFFPYFLKYPPQNGVYLSSGILRSLADMVSGNFFLTKAAEML